MATLSSAIDMGTRVLIEAGITTARLDATLLLTFILGIDRRAVTLLPQREINDEDYQRYLQVIARRRAQEPLAYITGTREFWSMDFRVTPDTLIPRPDSETLIAVATRLLCYAAPARIIDFGTGCGCLLLAALREFEDSHGVGIDISTAALEVAQHNAMTHDLLGRARFQQGNWGEGLTQGAELILANPPYIGESERHSLAPTVVDFEPAHALFAGADGLACYIALLPDIKRLLLPNGVAVIEIGHLQANAVVELAQAHSLCVQVHRDFAGCERALSLTHA